jgi:hypothetical protein
MRKSNSYAKLSKDWSTGRWNNAFKSQYSNLLIAEWPKNTHENPQIYDGSQSARYGRF